MLGPQVSSLPSKSGVVPTGTGPNLPQNWPSQTNYFNESVKLQTTGEKKCGDAVFLELWVNKIH